MYLMLPPSQCLGPSQTPNSSYPAFQPTELLRKLHSRENFSFQMRLYKPSGSHVTVQWTGFLPCSWGSRLVLTPVKFGSHPTARASKQLPHQWDQTEHQLSSPDTQWVGKISQEHSPPGKTLSGKAWPWTKLNTASWRLNLLWGHPASFTWDVWNNHLSNQRELGMGRKRWPQIWASGHLITFLSALSVLGSSHQIYLEKVFSCEETFENCLA